MNVQSITVNGQGVAAVAVLVDAVFGVLVAFGVIQPASRPDQGTIIAIVTVAFNLAAYILAYIQHSQHQTAVKLASQERQLQLTGGNVPPSMKRR